MLRNLGYLEEERNEQIRKENERRFQQEQQRINNQRLHEINERNRIALERENARRRAEEKRKAEQKRKETSRTNTNVPPSQPKNNRWSIGSNPTLLPRATSSKTATTKTNSSNKTDGKEGKKVILLQNELYMQSIASRLAAFFLCARMVYSPPMEGRLAPLASR